MLVLFWNHLDPGMCPPPLSAGSLMYRSSVLTKLWILWIHNRKCGAGGLKLKTWTETTL